jgi:coenzyme F420-0:L-glutamate ligase/coenzyme F420-1:gamma-L-glutamate ligase
LFCADAVARELELPDEWLPMATVAVGHAASRPPDHPRRDFGEYVLIR